MRSKSCSIGLLVGLIACAMIFVGCPKTQSPTKTVSLKQTSVPRKVFSIAGEVLAFKATGEAGRKQDVQVPLTLFQGRVGGFDRVFVYEFTGDGKVLSRTETKVNSDRSITIAATVDSSYLVYADLGERFRNGYDIACRLQQARVSRELIPRICTQIFCGGDVFTAASLSDRVPELKAAGLGDLGNGPTGGFRGSGNICEQCLHQGGEGDDFLPTKGCDGGVPPDPDPPRLTDKIVYTFTPFPFNAPSGNSQIYKMDSNGSNPVNLSNNQYYDFSPDVHHQTKQIVFVSSRSNGLHTMDINGGGVAAIPNTAAAGYPKWSTDLDPSFVVFTYPAWGANSAIYRIRTDGSERVQITTPAATERDEMADVVDSKFIVFTRMDNHTFNRDIYLKYIWDNRAAVNLTNSGVTETLPVVSHDRRLIAYRVFIGAEDEEIRVASLDTAAGTITILHTIRLSPSATYNISGLDFSVDDTRLFVSIQVNDVDGNLINRMQEIFSIKLDGTDQYRLTFNNDEDVYPSAVSP